MATNEPTWSVASLFPLQGQWSEEEYVALETNHLVEFADGVLEVLPLPSERHQDLVAFLYALLATYARATGGKAVFAPFRVRLRPGRHREPDVVYVSAEHRHWRHETHWDGADLVVEVLSPDDVERDTVTKRREYAEARIPEYWLVDPERETVTVLRLEGESYVEHGVASAGASVVSARFAGLRVDTGALFAK